MTIAFSNSMRYTYIHRGVLQGMSSMTAMNQNQVGYSACTVYAGARPTAAQILASWPTYNSSSNDLLAHWVSAGWTVPNITSATTGNVLTIIYAPANVMPIHSGTATWAIIWPGNISQASLSSSTIPSTSFMVVDVSDLNGVGVLKFNTLSVIVGVSHRLYSGSMYSIL